jgi:hypothetical protein
VNEMSAWLTLRREVFVGKVQAQTKVPYRTERGTMCGRRSLDGRGTKAQINRSSGRRSGGGEDEVEVAVDDIERDLRFSGVF